ncbi:MAG: EF-P lysine aminoacylase EpmA [Pseudomonadales bacterium]
MTVEHWQANTSRETLRARADLLARVRAFFDQLGVLEVDTPSLSRYSVSDPFLEAMPIIGADGQPVRWLQTSPEFAMKRLLASGSGDIYQICKAFRAGEHGRLHANEFTMLEWYRLNFDQFDLIRELCDLLRRLLNCAPHSQYSYGDLFAECIGFNPHKASYSALQQAAIESGFGDLLGADQHQLTKTLDRNALLDLLFSHIVQPTLSKLSVVYDYPESMAALARVEYDSQGCKVARRFEVFYQGVELANGYHELLDASELEQRTARDNTRRKELGKVEQRCDPRLLAAMRHGLPECAGVAVGLDRVLMLALGAKSIADVRAF